MIYSSGILLNSNLVGYWPLNGNATDFKSGNNGTLVAGSFGTTVVPSIIGQSSALASGYVNIPTNAAYDFGTTTDFSVEFMFNTSNITNQQVLVDHRSSASDGWYVTVLGGGLGVSNFNVVVGGTLYSGPLIDATNTWYHGVVVVKRTTNITFYINNTPTVVSSATNAKTASSAGQLTIGGRAFTQPQFVISGSMANVSIYNAELSADVIAQHYNQFMDGMPTVPNFGYDSKIL